MPVDKKPSGSGKATAVVLRVPAPGGCERARKLAGKTFEAADAPKLPLRECGRVDCRCRYEPVTDRRRKTRRDDGERRDLIRFETKTPRRSADRRKRNNLWDQR